MFICQLPWEIDLGETICARVIYSYTVIHVYQHPDSIKKYTLVRNTLLIKLEEIINLFFFKIVY